MCVSVLQTVATAELSTTLKDSVIGAKHEETACTATTSHLTHTHTHTHTYTHTHTHTHTPYSLKKDLTSIQIRFHLPKRAKHCRKNLNNTVQLHCQDHMSVIIYFLQVSVTFNCTLCQPKNFTNNTQRYLKTRTPPPSPPPTHIHTHKV